MLVRASLLVASLLLGGCLARVPVSQIDAFVHPQEQAPLRIGGGAGAPAKPRLWYVGLGLYDESWSENDVAELATRLAARADGFQTVPIVLSNAAAGRRYPGADATAVERATAEIGRRAGKGDVVMLYVSTHGAPGILARKEGGQDEIVDAGQLRRWLAPVQGMDTVVVLSACFSGSLIPALQAENRIVIAAARADRTSFGGKAGNRHTLFGQALLDSLDQPSESLHAAFDKTRAEIGAMERAQAIRRPSEPQVSVGGAVTALYDAPVF